MSAEISKVAAEWAARLDRGLSGAEAARLAAWRASDPRCEGALLRARAVLVRYDRARALGLQFDPGRFRPSSPLVPTRRMLVWGGGTAIAASVAGAAAWLGGGYLPETYVARRGEVRLVSLSDGSRVTLDSGSKVYVRYSKRVRALHLVQGEALFDVAKNRSRPFIVNADDLSVRAVGTSFSVRLAGGRPTRVLVREGVVEVTRRAAPRVEASLSRASAPESPVRLAANQAAISAPQGGIARETLAPVELEAALAWKDGMIAFKHTTLGEAAREFARYSDTPIVLDDPELAGVKITGLYSASDPAGFAQAAALSLQLKATVVKGEIHLSR